MTTRVLETSVERPTASARVVQDNKTSSRRVGLMKAVINPFQCLETIKRFRSPEELRAELSAFVSLHSSKSNQELREWAEDNKPDIFIILVVSINSLDVEVELVACEAIKALFSFDPEESTSFTEEDLESQSIQSLNCTEPGH
ncbi:hypothetical protein SARC_05651 [Sphaeroforma arctica JP610]|uniref:Uncharacterized protein n=1 Tax=Sphaeroforma arctica JP610 TaxID=667725 RepID=A0A0L0FYY9_9EUKA|nr:hypothetical protein SARC_05651 [Sphaeroforma arctica JP610]KNC82057.1 hypothetical protein SARC_05651 [Sphaeroforma arctica JP610]|eukprot:XP_014155959.1 hypothetical protein SARC_05651 [Sphaeroforma arctica JP610]